MATRTKTAPKKPPSVRQVRLAAGIKEPKSAIALLKADHREVEGLFKTFKRSKSDTEKQTVALKICAALKVHAQIEEEIFYPAFIAATGKEDIHNEALVEHDAAKKLIAEIEKGAKDPLFDAKVTVLSEMIKHHVREEEGFGGMFVKARVAGMDMLALGALLEARKQQLTREPAKARTKTPRGTRPAFMGAAALARGKGHRPHARRAP